MQSIFASRILALGLTVASVPLRLITNLRWINAFGFNSLGALGMFGGSKLPLWQAMFLPVVVMMGTDLFLTFYFGSDLYNLLHVSRLCVYPAMAMYAVVGRYYIGDGKEWLRVAGGPVVGTVVFVLVADFGSWLELTQLYPRTAGGLLACYLAGMEFTMNILAGNMIFTYIAFALHAALCRQTQDDAACAPANGMELVGSSDRSRS